jgi:hypothetical protein
VDLVPRKTLKRTLFFEIVVPMPLSSTIGRSSRRGRRSLAARSALIFLVLALVTSLVAAG